MTHTSEYGESYLPLKGAVEEYILPLCALKNAASKVADFTLDAMPSEVFLGLHQAFRVFGLTLVGPIYVHLNELLDNSNNENLFDSGKHSPESPDLSQLRV
ncbi:unnamed protein product, partial [Protopolystoma xenopodis]